MFEIDELRCVVCGLCVEACPCDAIRMDTGEHAQPVEDRADAIETQGVDARAAASVRSRSRAAKARTGARAGREDIADDVNR